MPGQPQAEGRLTALLEQARAGSEKLLDFTRRHQAVLSGDDAAAITQVLEQREPLVRALIDLENQINRTRAEVGATNGALPPEAEKLRRAVRDALDAVTELDAAAQKALCGHLQDYKALTIRARNKKHISTYIRSGQLASPPKHYDVTK